MSSIPKAANLTLKNAASRISRIHFLFFDYAIELASIPLLDKASPKMKVLCQYFTNVYFK